MTPVKVRLSTVFPFPQSTVLAAGSWTQGFEFSLSAVLAYWDSADEVGVRSVSDLVLGGFLAWLAEGGAI